MQMHTWKGIIRLIFFIGVGEENKNANELNYFKKLIQLMYLIYTNFSSNLCKRQGAE